MKKNDLDIDITVERLVVMVKADKDFCDIHDNEEYFYVPRWLVLFFRYLRDSEVRELLKKIAHPDDEKK